MPTAQFMYIAFILSLCIGFLSYIALKVAAIYSLLKPKSAEPEP